MMSPKFVVGQQVVINALPFDRYLETGLSEGDILTIKDAHIITSSSTFYTFEENAGTLHECYLTLPRV